MREPGRLITAMVTPFQPDGSLDREGAARLARRLVETGVDTVLLNGTTGENPVLSHEEKLQLLETVVEAVGTRVPVMMGTGTNCTADSIALTREAEARGADSIMLVVPYYNRPPQEGLYRHFEAIAGATSLPVMLYNIQSRTSADMLPETVVRLSQIPNIFALKEASGHVGRTAEVLSAARSGFRVYSGDDSATIPIMALGGYGVVSVAGNIAGRLLKELVESAAGGKRDQAVALYQSLLPLLKALFITTNPIPLKCALKLMGLPGGSPRPPLIDATPAEEEVVRRALEDLRLLG